MTLTSLSVPTGPWSDASLILSIIDCNVHGLPVVGASPGASGEGVKSSVPVALRTICGRSPSIPERESRQRFHRSGHVQQLRIGVDVHGQVDRGMTHGGLCRSRRHPALAQQRAEGVAKGMNVNRPAAFVRLSIFHLPGDTSTRRAMPAATKSRSRIRTSSSGHGEQRHISRQPQSTADKIAPLAP